MGDYDRDREPARDTERTTIIESGRRGGGGGLAIVAVVIVAVLALLFLLFGGYLNRAADEVGVNVDVAAPKLDIKVPDVEVNIPEKIELTVPEAKDKTDEAKPKKK
jgi:hypothetical protein